MDLSGSETVRNMSGVIPPMITPFAEDDTIARELLRKETEYMLRAGVAAIVVAGSTGEGAGMSAEEIYEAVDIVVQTVSGRVPVLCGVIADTTEEAVRLGIAARKAGAVGLQVPPPHFHIAISTAVLSRYYGGITDGTGLPLIIYNVIPWAQVAVDSLEQLTAENRSIIGIKQSGANIHALSTLLAFFKGRIRVYSAIDDLVYPSFMLGADGTISGTSSVFPIDTTAMWKWVQSGDIERALSLHQRLVPVWRSLDGPQFPARLKYALTLLGRNAGKPRSPFTWPSGAAAERIERTLTEGGFIATRGAAVS